MVWGGCGVDSLSRIHKHSPKELPSSHDGSLYEAQCSEVNADRCSDEISTRRCQRCGVRNGALTRVRGIQSPHDGFESRSHSRKSKTASRATVAYVFRCELSSRSMTEPPV
jgi:hypothetical protein